MSESPKLMTGTAAKRPNSPTITYVKNAKELKELPYDLQGDEDMLLPHNIRAREANRDNTTVIASLQAFWDAVVHDRNGDGMIDAADFEAAKAGRLPDVPGAEDESDEEELDTSTFVMTREHYIEVYSRISAGLLPPPKKGQKVDDAEARRQAEEAWEQDTSGDVLEFERGQFFDSLFELCDLWARGVKAQEYTSFLRQILESVVGAEAMSAGYWRRAPGYWRDAKVVKKLSVEPPESAKRPIREPAPFIQEREVALPPKTAQAVPRSAPPPAMAPAPVPPPALVKPKAKPKAAAPAPVRAPIDAGPVMEQIVNEVVDEECAAIAREVIQAEAEVAVRDQIVEEVVKEEAGKIAAEALVRPAPAPPPPKARENLPPLEPIRDQIVDEVVEEMSAEVAREALDLTGVMQTIVDETVAEMCAEIAAEALQKPPPPKPPPKAKATPAEIDLARPPPPLPKAPPPPPPPPEAQPPRAATPPPPPPPPPKPEAPKAKAAVKAIAKAEPLPPPPPKKPKAASPPPLPEPPAEVPRAAPAPKAVEPPPPPPPASPEPRAPSPPPLEPIRDQIVNEVVEEMSAEVAREVLDERPRAPKPKRPEPAAPPEAPRPCDEPPPKPERSPLVARPPTPPPFEPPAHEPTRFIKPKARGVLYTAPPPPKNLAKPSRLCYGVGMEAKGGLLQGGSLAEIARAMASGKALARLAGDEAAALTSMLGLLPASTTAAAPPTRPPRGKQRGLRQVRSSPAMAMPTVRPWTAASDEAAGVSDAFHTQHEPWHQHGGAGVSRAVADLHALAHPHLLEQHPLATPALAAAAGAAADSSSAAVAQQQQRKGRAKQQAQQAQLAQQVQQAQEPTMMHAEQKRRLLSEREPRRCPAKGAADALMLGVEMSYGGFRVEYDTTQRRHVFDTSRAGIPAIVPASAHTRVPPWRPPAYLEERLRAGSLTAPGDVTDGRRPPSVAAADLRPPSCTMPGVRPPSCMSGVYPPSNGSTRPVTTSSSRPLSAAEAALSIEVDLHPWLLATTPDPYPWLLSPVLSASASVEHFDLAQPRRPAAKPRPHGAARPSSHVRPLASRASHGAMPATAPAAGPLGARAPTAPANQMRAQQAHQPRRISTAHATVQQLQQQQQSGTGLLQPLSTRSLPVFAGGRVTALDRPVCLQLFRQVVGCELEVRH